MPHIHEKIDFCAEVFVVFQDKVLLRKHDKYHIWLSVGGHIELDEDPSQAAVREVKEEVGLDITLLDTRARFRHTEDGDYDLIAPYFMNRHFINEVHEHVVFGYIGEATTDQVIPEKPTDEWRWFTKEELEAEAPALDIRKSIVYYALSALKEVAAAHKIAI